ETYSGFPGLIAVPPPSASPRPAGSVRVTAEDSPAQFLPEAVDVLEPGRLQRRQVLVQGRREGPPGRGPRRPSPPPPHRRQILRHGAFAMASRGRDAIVPLVQRSGSGR